MLPLYQWMFWLFVFLAIYPYFIYPCILFVSTRLTRRSAAVPANADEPLPSVTIVISARDEEDIIEHKVVSSLGVDYPAEQLSLVVVSDASTDRTNDIVRQIAGRDPRVRLLDLDEHLGKTAGLNRALENIASDIVVFTDANAIFDNAAIGILVEELRSDGVGYAVGSALYTTSPGNSAGENEGLYWRYELALKEMESDFESVVGGDGAIYAIWRNLYTPLEAHDINDFMNPLQIIAAGYRGVFSSRAIAYEDPANDYAKEFRRKRRIVCRSWGATVRFGLGRIFAVNKRFAFMLISHKLIRWFTCLWVTLAAVANVAILLAGGPGLYVFTGGLIAISLLLAFIGGRRVMSDKPSPFYFIVPYYFYVSNFAALLGIADYMLGNRYVTWEHVRT